MSPFLRLFLFGAFLTTTGGSAGGLRSWGRHDQTRTSAKLSTTRPQIDRGAARPVIDGIGTGCRNPIEDDSLGPTDQQPRELTRSGIVNHAICQRPGPVGYKKVRLNQDQPIDEWRRLNANRAVEGGCRYTLGVLASANEAIFPGLIFGFDR